MPKRDSNPGGETPTLASRRKKGNLRRSKTEVRRQVDRVTVEKKSAKQKKEKQSAKVKEREKSIVHLAPFPELNPNPVVEIDLHGSVYYQNPAARRLFPDLSIQGASHPYLAGVGALIPLSKNQTDLSITREKEVGLSWYHQSLFYSSQWNRIRVYGFDISEKKKAEEAVRESERKFKTLFEGSQDGYVRVDMEGKIQECNTAYGKMLGYTAEELKKLTFMDLTPQKWHHFEAQIVNHEVLPRGHSGVYEKEYIRKDGTIFPVSLQTYLIEDPEGKPQGMWAFVRDNTERMKAEDELRRANERLQDLSKITRDRADELDRKVSERTRELRESNEILEGVFSSMDLLLAHLDRDFNFIRVNRAYAAADEREPEFYPGKNHFALFPNEENEAIFRRVVETGEPYHVAEKAFTYAEHPERGVTYWDWSLYPVKEADGKVSGVVLNLVNVTERKRAQQALRRTEDLLHKVLETLPVGVWVADKDGKILSGNPAGRKIWGGARYVGVDPYGEFKSWWADTGKQIDPEEWALARAVHRGETSLNEVMEIECFDGRRKTVLNSAAPLRGPAGEILGAILVNEDITERKRAEESLALERNRMKGVLENMPNGVYISNRRHEIEYLNPVLENEFGPVNGRKCYEYFHDRQDVCPWCRSEEAFAGRTVRWEWFSPKNGKTYDLFDTPLPNADGTLSKLEIFHDITERKKAEEALRQNEQLLRNILELLPIGVWISDRDGTITYGNPAGHRIWGGHRYVGIDRIGEYKGWWLHTGKQIEPEEWAVVRAVRKGETSLNEEIEIESFDGSRKIILNSAIPLRNERNEIIGAFVINDDITERRQTEQRIRQMQKMEALGTLVGGIAHDFNNILMPIIINTDLAFMDVKKGVLPSPNYLQLVKQAAARGHELVKQIITFSRQREQPRQPVDITPVIKEAIKFIRASVPKNIEIRSSIDVDPAVVLADPTQIHQVLMNLCSNAAHAMRGRGGTLKVSLTRVEIEPEGEVRLTVGKPGPYLRLSVSDTGHGMNPEVKERAFDPFFTTKNPGEGTGMGLSVVHGIIKNHEGAITLESEVGKGTTFHVFLPWVQTLELKKELPHDPIPAGKERILLIDDEEIQARTVQHMLERLGYRVTAKNRAQEALETFRTQPDAFDLVITDHTMPELSGANLAKEVLQMRPDMPVILYTGYSETFDEEEARSIGIRDFALKPLTVRDLAERIRKALKK